MYCVKKMTEDLYWVGASERRLNLFENAYPLTNGVSYNSYLLLDEKTVLIDTVDKSVSGLFFENVDHVLAGRKLDYLIVQHMEPDHAATISELVLRHPEVTVVCNAKTRTMMQNFFTFDLDSRVQLVKEMDTLTTGRHTFAFVMAPMVHWPEVIVTYDCTDKVLFSADGLGKFGALDVEDPEGWACEARRYYFGIVGKFGAQVQALLKKAAAVDIQTVCPLHGPVLTGEELAEALRLYDIWSRYDVESEGVMIAYASVYGNTEKAAQLLAEKLKEQGCPKVVLTCVQREDWAEAVEDAFRYGKLVLAAPTYNGFLFPAMREFLEHLTERNYQNRQVAFIENGSWAPAAAKEMKKLLEGCKNVTLGSTVTIRSAMTEETPAQLDALAQELR